MIKENCILCLDKITNPVCEDCYLKQINNWMESIKLKSRKNILSQIRKNINFDSLNESDCILCNKNKVSVCSYCFFKKVSKIFKKINLQEEFIQTFQASFNYVESYEKEEVFA